MPHPITGEIRCESRRVRDFGGLYTALVLLSFHGALVLYINSSFLEQFFSNRMIGLLYTLSSAVTILLFIYTPLLMRTWGDKLVLSALTILEGVVLTGLAFANDPRAAALLFILHQAVVPVLFYLLDVFMEKLTGDCEQETGGRRGIFLTIMSLTIALSALLSGYLIGDTDQNYTLVYLASATLLIPFLGIIFHAIRAVPKTAAVNTEPFRVSVRTLMKKPDIRNVFCANFLLQLFFAWMVVYTPIYFHTTLNLPWDTIGEILFVGLMAYVLLEYIVGVIADRWLGEKEFMALGFLITAVATSWLAFLTAESIPLLMVALFMTRVGASLIEVTTESYFFKHTHGDDDAIVSFFRMTRPLSYIIGALLGSITLFFVPMELMFIVLGLLMVPGLFFTMMLKDTR